MVKALVTKRWSANDIDRTFIDLVEGVELPADTKPAHLRRLADLGLIEALPEDEQDLPVIPVP